MNTQITEAVDALLPVVKENRDEAEASRQLPSKLWQAIRTSKLTSMSVPTRRGGLGTSLPDMLRVFEAIAAEDAAVSWVIWNASLVGFYSRYLSDEVREKLFSVPGALFCQSTIPAGQIDLHEDHATITGRWPLVSGCSGADWVVLTGNKLVRGEPCLSTEGVSQTLLAVLPREAFEVLDTWHSSGLRGTGSHDVRLEGVRLALQDTFSIEVDPDRRDTLDYLPIFATISAMFAAQILGLGRAVYEYSTERGQIPAGINALRERQDFQVAIAHHGTALNSAGNELYNVAARVWSRVERNKGVSREDTVDLYAAGFVVMNVVRKAVGQFHEFSGTSGLYTGSPIEKPVRDLHAMLRHIVAQPVMQSDVGRYRLGLDPAWGLFFI